MFAHTFLKNLFIFIISGFLTLVLILSPVRSSFNEYQVKAAFLYNLARMVEWPNYKENQDSLNICFVGGNPFGDALDSIRRKTVRNRPINFSEDVTLSQAERCHILFIAELAMQSSLFDNFLSVAEQESILTISDVKGFAEQGGVVSLVRYGERIQIEVNLRAARKADVKISSRLLALAKIVEE